MDLLGWLTRERTVRGRRAPSALDWIVAIALLVIALGEVAGGVFGGPAGIAAALQVAVILPVAFRRVAPLQAIATSAVAAFLVELGQGAGTSAADGATLLLLAYSVGRHTRGRRLVAGATMVLVVVALALAGAGLLFSVSDWAYMLILAGGSFGLGVALRVQTERSIALAVAADRSRRTHGTASRAAVLEERGRIARELHEVVAHNVGLIVLQAGGARSVLASDPERARTALLQVEETGRQTLHDMRHLVGILRVDDDAGVQPPAPLTPAATPVDEAPVGAPVPDGRLAPSVLDWLLTLALIVIALVEVAGGMFSGPAVIAAALQVAAILPVAFRRLAPLRAIAISTAVSVTYLLAYGVVQDAGGSVAVAGTQLLLVYSVGRHARGRALLAGAGIALLVAVEPGIGRQATLDNAAIMIILVAGTLGLGVALRIQTERAIALAVAADRADSEQVAAAQAAVQGERARIARELHDVVAHNVGLIVLQAGGGRTVLATDPERTRAALRQIEETGRQTLAEMRHLVGILREGEDEVEVRQPLPRLDRLPALVEEARTGGLTVNLAVEGSPVELSAGLELAVYRLVQEALTNVRKHAPSSHVEVRLGYEADQLLIEVSDDGRPPDAAESPARDTPDAGHGLIGMRERVQVYGGRMQTRPIPGGGFLVEAMLPLRGEAA